MSFSALFGSGFDWEVYEPIKPVQPSYSVSYQGKKKSIDLNQLKSDILKFKKSTCEFLNPYGIPCNQCAAMHSITEEKCEDFAAQKIIDDMVR